MRNLLNYQVTEYDCGPTTLINAINFLFSREDISPELIKAINLYCLDAYNKEGEIGKSGTSAMALLFISNWLNQYGKVKNFPIHTSMLKPTEIHIEENSEIVKCLMQGGVAVVRVYFDGGHYVLLTAIDDEYIYLFDPYYVDEPIENAEIVSNAPYKMNRKVRKEIFNSETHSNYSFGEIELRECMLIYNTDICKIECNKKSIDKK